MTTTFMLTCLCGVIAQPPQAFKYQAVVRDNAGEILQNQSVGIRVSIHDVSAGGTIVCQETHTQTTNQFGLVNLEIGTGTPTIGSFSAIDWGSATKFLEIEIDPSGGASYFSIGTSQLMSVPYALYSYRSPLLTNKGTGNIFIGKEAALSNTTGNSNVFAGYQSGFKNTIGYVNSFFGCQSGFNNTEGAGNTFVGFTAGYNNTTGGLNTFIGDRSGIENTTGIHNTYLGYKSGHNNITGSNNVCIGYKAGYYETGSNKLYISNAPSSNALIYGEFDNQVLVFNADVGIGTTDPDAGLHVARNYSAITGVSTDYGGVGKLGAGSDGVIGSAIADQGSAFQGIKFSGTGEALYIQCNSANASTARFYHDVYGSSENCVNIVNRTSGHALFAENIFGGVAMFVTNNSSSGWAGIFDGSVHVTGNLSKAAGSFVIDHPLDPENKLLRHNFVESSENLLIYRDKVELDKNGEAIVHMPAYFEALTMENEATVGLTSIGKPFLTGYEWEPGYKSFKIYGEPNRSVSWIVCADRDDPVIHEHSGPVEQEKKPDDLLCPKGKLLNPEAYGYPKTMGRYYRSTDEMGTDPKKN